MNKSIDFSFKLHYAGFHLEIEESFSGHGVTAIFGPSGCGKTTLLRLIAGLEAPDQGRLSVLGEVWQSEHRSLAVHKRDIGMVFQNANLFPHLSVRKNLEYGIKRIEAPKRSNSLERAVELLGISHLLERKPSRLSGGEQQRVAIARALAINPQVLLMDEPLAALDYQRKKEILPYLQRLQEEWQKPILYVTHSPDEVAQLANYLCVLHAGKCMANGPVQDVLARNDLPISIGEEASSVFDVCCVGVDAKDHLMELSLDGQSLWMREQSLRDLARVRIRILARDVSLCNQKSDESSILNHLQGTVERITEGTHPAQALVLVRVGTQPLLARITYRALHKLNIQVGRNVWAQVKTMALME